MNTKVKGVSFLGFAADGTSTIEGLTTQKKELEARLAQIPSLISGLNHSITVVQNDITWVKSLGFFKKRDWEKEKGTTAEEWIRAAEANVAKMKGQVASLTAEKEALPGQIKAIQDQITILVQGQSKGLEKGYDNETAKQLGQLEVEKEKARLAQEKELREAEIRAEQQRQQQIAANQEKAGSNQTKIFIGIGVAIVLAIIGMFLYKKFAAKPAAA